MLIDELVKTPALWMSTHGAGIIVSSRVRLARNIRDVAFPGWAGEDECTRLCGDIKAALAGTASLANPVFLDMDQCSEVDKLVLGERNLISPELAEKGRGSALAIDESEKLAIMINEEDHLRIQSVRSGMHLRAVWKSVNALDSELEGVLDFAFSSRLGYLTSCPSNVGTGLRASVMMHLAGLRLVGDLDAVLNGLGKLGLAVRGIFGEGSDAFGNMYQISNQSTLGESEMTIIRNLEHVVREIKQHEQNARLRLLEQKRVYLLDHVARACAILRNALIFSSGEAMDLLSALRLGAELGLVENLSGARINELMLCSQPGHLQKVAGKVLAPRARDELRSTIIRKKLRQMELAKEFGVGVL